MSHDAELREYLADFLDCGHAHADFDAALDGLAREHRGVRPSGSPHSAWELLEHIRLGQWDILEFSRDASHVSPEWPKGYWPATPEPPSDAAWDESVARFRSDRAELIKMLRDEKNDIFGRIAHGTGQTLIREVLLVIDHNSYHLGQLVLVKRMLAGA